MVTEAWGMLTPQSGDDVMFDVAVGIGTGGLGLLGRNLDEAVSGAKGLDELADGAAETFRILDGVRRAKATELARKSDEIAAVIERAGQADQLVSLRLDSLLSSKDMIDVTAQTVPGQIRSPLARFMELFDAAKAGSIRDPIRVTPSSSGVPLSEVRLGIPK